MDSAYLSQTIDSGEESAAQLNLPVPLRARRASMCDPIVLEEIEKDKYKTVSRPYFACTLASKWLIFPS